MTHTSTIRVVVVDDDENVRVVVNWQLADLGFDVHEAGDGREALRTIAEAKPHLVVLDLSLPMLGGLDVLRTIRRGSVGIDQSLPVIVLSGRDGEMDRIVGLDLGADDYLVKPFSPGELAARVRSVLRRSSPAASGQRCEVAGVILDPATRSVTRAGRAVDLTAKEFDLLHFMMSHPRQVFSRAQLLDHVWNSSTEWLGDATVTEHVHRLRIKLEADGLQPLIKTVRGAGYLLDSE